MQPAFNLKNGILQYSRALQKQYPSDHPLMTMWGRYRCTPSSLPCILGENGNYIEAKDFERLVANNMANSRLLFNYMFKTTFNFASKQVKIDEGDYGKLLKLIHNPDIFGYLIYDPDSSGRFVCGTRTYDIFDMNSTMGGVYSRSVFSAQFQNTSKENALAFISAVNAQLEDFSAYIREQALMSREQAIHVAVRTGACYSIFISSLQKEVDARE